MSQLKEMEFEKGKNQMICGLGKMANLKKNRYVKKIEEKFNKLKLMGFSKNKHWMICGLVKVESSTKFFMKS